MNLREWLDNIDLVEPSLKGKSKTAKRKFIILNVSTMAAVWTTGFDQLPDEKEEADPGCV